MNNTAQNCQYCNKDHNWVQQPCLELLDFWNLPNIIVKKTKRTKHRKNTPLEQV